ncbi:MAG: PASTA domain-containing protein [Balneolaceae bacterium]
MDFLKKLFTSKVFYISVAGIGIAGIALILLFDFVIMPRYTNFNEGITVPDVTKLSLQEAEDRIESAGLRYEVLDRRANTVYPADYIIDQTPSPLQIVKPNRKIYLTVNTATQPTTVVPRLVDMSLRNAQVQIENRGLQLGSISMESSRFRNVVLRQSIAEGDTVARGSIIHLTVSDGLGDRQVVVPDIVGLSYSEAQQAIRRAGLRVGEVRFEPSREATPNTVLSFSPNEEQLTEGESLTLVLAERFDLREEVETGAVGADTTAVPPDTSNDNQNQPNKE